MFGECSPFIDISLLPRSTALMPSSGEIPSYGAMSGKGGVKMAEPRLDVGLDPALTLTAWSIRRPQASRNVKLAEIFLRLERFFSLRRRLTESRATPRVLPWRLLEPADSDESTERVLRTLPSPSHDTAAMAAVRWHCTNSVPTANASATCSASRRHPAAIVTRPIGRSMLTLSMLIVCSSSSRTSTV